ncbi:Helix-turn-helix domain (DUF4817) [Popillia japonica]|uniref:Helix-turn-helix domain (DUF4817) n=1 Tax=Popillia japonica TaxID=7064 RepID=A0AAW1JFD6_POPJA
MLRWTNELRAFAVKAFYKNADSAQRASRRDFNLLTRDLVPSANAINVWVRNFEETGNVTKKRGGSVRTARTPENVNRVWLVRTFSKVKRYAEMLVKFAFPAFDEHVNDRSLFQQDGATSHTAIISMDLLKLAFPGRLISRNGDIFWPACSPDLTAPDFFLSKAKGF